MSLIKELIRMRYFRVQEIRLLNLYVFKLLPISILKSSGTAIGIY